MDLQLKENGTELLKAMQLLSGNYFTSFGNGLNLLVRLGNLCKGAAMDEDMVTKNMENPTLTDGINVDQRSQGDGDLCEDITVATIQDNTEKQVSIVEPDLQLGKVPVGLVTQKYQNALQTLYDFIPEHLRDVERITHKLYSNRVLLKSELERLRCAFKAKGTLVQVVKLLDVLMNKSEKDVRVFIGVLDECNQNELASLIRKTADEYETGVYNNNILTRKQLLTDPSIGTHMREFHQKALQEHTGKEKTFDFILSGVPLPDPNCQEIQQFVGQEKHLHVSLTTLMGNQKVLDSFNHAFYKLKSDFVRAVGVTCSCAIDDKRKDESKTSCNALISVGLSAGERKAFDILEAKMLELENHILRGSGQIVSIIEGCIKIRIQVNDSYHLQDLHNDIKSGALLYRITQWLKKEEYCSSENSDNHPAFMLTVDEDAILALQSSLEKEETGSGNRLTFPVSYAYCPHEKQWYWSPDRTHWYDQTTKIATNGFYQNKMIGQTDEMMLTLMKESNMVPSTLPEHCIPCALKDHAKSDTSLPLRHKQPVPKIKAESEPKTKMDTKSGVLMETLSELFNRTCPVELFSKESNAHVHIPFTTQMERLIADMWPACDQNTIKLEYYGKNFDGMPLVISPDIYFQCLFVSQQNLVGYRYDIPEDEGVTYFIASDGPDTNYLKLQTKQRTTYMHGEKEAYHSSAQVSKEFASGINQSVSDKFDKELYDTLFPGVEMPTHFEKARYQFDHQQQNYPFDDQQKHHSFDHQQKEHPPECQQKDWLHERQQKDHPSFHTIRGCITGALWANAAVNTSGIPLVWVQHQNYVILTNCRVSLAYPCTSWPTCAANWVHRMKPHGWPSEEFIDETLTDGCYVIPSPSSGDDFNWEFCFDIIAKKLLDTLPIQYKQVLFLLSMISDFQSSALPTMAHWQSTLFWECEAYGIMHENVADIFCRLIDRMLACIASKNIPDYFIDKWNLVKDYSDSDVDNVCKFLEKIRSKPVDFLSDHFTIHQYRLLPKSKTLKAIFEKGMHHEDQLDTCVSDLISLLLYEKNDGAALDQILCSPHPNVYLKLCPESWLAKIAPLLKIKDDFLFSKYLVESFPNSQNIARYKCRLGLLYHSFTLHGADVFGENIPSEFLTNYGKTKTLFKEALQSVSNTDRDVQIHYAYYLYLEKEYEMAVGCVQDLISKPLEIEPVLQSRKEFLEKDLWTLPIASEDVILWHYTFGLYILIKCYQRLGRALEAKKYLNQLADAAFQIPVTKGGTIEVHMASLGLLGKAASDLEDDKLSLEANKQKSELQSLVALAENSKACRWLIFPSGAYGMDFKFTAESYNSKEK